MVATSKAVAILAKVRRTSRIGTPRRALSAAKKRGVDGGGVEGSGVGRFMKSELS